MTQRDPLLHRGGSIPHRLIDPEGEGIYFCIHPGHEQWGILRTAAWEFYADARLYREINWEQVYMREDDEGYWHPVSRRWWHDMLLPFRWAPKVFAYLTPKPEVM